MLVFIIAHSCNAIQKLDFLFCICPIHPLFYDMLVLIVPRLVKNAHMYNLTVPCVFTSFYKLPVINVCHIYHEPSMPQYPDGSSSNEAQ